MECPITARTFSDFTTAGTMLFQAIRNGTLLTDAQCNVRCGATILDYASTFLPDSPSPVMASPALSRPQLADSLERACHHGVKGVGFNFDWRAIVAAILKLINDLLFPPPTTTVAVAQSKRKGK